MMTTREKMDARFAGMEIEDFTVETIKAVRDALIRLTPDQIDAERHGLVLLLANAIGAVQREREFAESR